MISPVDEFYLQQPEPLRGCLLFLRAWLLKEECTEAFNYHTPFFRYKQKPFCYFILQKKGCIRKFLILSNNNNFDMTHLNELFPRDSQEILENKR